MLRVILLGAPGSGKGTQAVRLARSSGARHISTGDLLRSEVAAGTELGQRVAGYLDRGELVPDDVLLELTLPLVRAAALDGGYILDGFPRSVEQARALDAGSADGLAVAGVVLLSVPRAELMQRMLHRAAEQGRPDDTAGVIARRLEVFDSDTAPLIEYYRGVGKLVEVEATGDPDVIAQRIRAVLAGDQPA